MSEYDLLQQMMLAATRMGARLFRNNTGTGWVGKTQRGPATVRMGPDDVLIRNARPLHAGLTKGSADLIGWVPVTITQEMVGKTVAVFAGVEAKTKGVRTTDEQRTFINVVNTNGGMAGIAHDLDELAAIIKRPPPK